MSANDTTKSRALHGPARIRICFLARHSYALSTLSCAQDLLALLRILALLSRVGWEGEFQHLFDCLDVMRGKALQLFGREILLDVGAVVGWEDDVVHAGALCGENLFFYAADRKHIAAQRNFAGHGGQRANLLAREQRD